MRVSTHRTRQMHNSEDRPININGEKILMCPHLYDLTGVCIGVTPAVWSACPDSVQARRFTPELLAILQPWTKSGKLICAGAFDGGFYSNEIATKLRWSTPVPSSEQFEAQQRRVDLQIRSTC